MTLTGENGGAGRKMYPSAILPTTLAPPGLGTNSVIRGRRLSTNRLGAWKGFQEEARGEFHVIHATQ
jgi:hypothetical protein